MLSKKSIKQFKEIYQRKWGERLSDDEAFRKANKLLNLYKAVYGSVSLEQIKESNNVNERDNQQP